MKEYFVIINHPNGKPVFLEDGEENAMVFTSFREAEEVADNNPFADSFGYEVFQRGQGL